jgi:hypothetical protein
MNDVQSVLFDRLEGLDEETQNRLAIAYMEHARPAICDFIDAASNDVFTISESAAEVAMLCIQREMLLSVHGVENLCDLCAEAQDEIFAEMEIAREHEFAWQLEQVSA